MSRGPRYRASGKNSSILSVDMASLNSLISGLQESAGQAVRPASQAAAQVFYDTVMAKVSQIPAKTGNLKSSIYQVYSKDRSADGVKASYHVSWNAKKAPHGHLVEYGHIQRYRMYWSKKHQDWRPAVRPEKRGTPPPKGKSAGAKAARDAYYVLLPTPKQVAAQPFIRPALSKADEAVKAAEAKMISMINGATA